MCCWHCWSACPFYCLFHSASSTLQSTLPLQQYCQQCLHSCSPSLDFGQEVCKLCAIVPICNIRQHWQPTMSMMSLRNLGAHVLTRSVPHCGSEEKKKCWPRWEIPKKDAFPKELFNNFLRRWKPRDMDHQWFFFLSSTSECSPTGLHNIFSLWPSSRQQSVVIIILHRGASCSTPSE